MFQGMVFEVWDDAILEDTGSENTLVIKNGYVLLFNSISTILGYSMPNPSF